MGNWAKLYVQIFLAKIHQMKGVFMDDYVYDEFSFNFPAIAKKVVDCYSIGRDELILKLSDGEVYSYDNNNKSLRILPPDSNSLTEEECRREFAIRLRRMMLIKGMTQVQLSDVTGIQQYLISDYMKGKRTPGFYNLDKMAKALDCSIDELRYH